VEGLTSLGGVRKEYDLKGWPWGHGTGELGKDPGREGLRLVKDSLKNCRPESN